MTDRHLYPLGIHVNASDRASVIGRHVPDTMTTTAGPLIPIVRYASLMATRRRCTFCERIAPCLHVDNSGGEYTVEYVCQECIALLLAKTP